MCLTGNSELVCTYLCNVRGKSHAALQLNWAGPIETGRLHNTVVK